MNSRQSQNRGQSPIPLTRSFPRTALFIASGIIIWALHFTAIYGLTALACARGWNAAVVPGLWVATALAALASLAVIAAGWRRRHVFEYWLAATIAGLGLVAIVYEAVTILMVPACG